MPVALGNVKKTGISDCRPLKRRVLNDIQPCRIRTIEQLENRKISRTERERPKRVAAMPASQIDMSDIPDMSDKTGWVRVHDHPEHPLHRILSRLVSIRLPEPDIALAQELARPKELPYQTYIKSLLHEALERERVLAQQE
jgi:hypothetical protein